MKKLLFIALIFAGCQREAQKEVQSTNQNFSVELLFEVDGCKMYRFSDGGRYIYWSDCKGKTQYNYIEQSGKSQNTIREETITTK